MIKETYFPQKSKWIFLFLLLALSLVYNYHKILFRPPGVVHQWRQADCLSLAANYYNFGMDFFSPAVYFAGNDGTGKTASEFPIVYYIVAFLWKIFGQHEFIFRLVNLSIVYSGLFFLFRFVEEKLRDSFWAIMVALLVFTSPILVYYSNGFIMDPLGLSFAFIAWYQFNKFYTSGNNRHLNLAMLFFLIGGLLKVSSMFSYFALLGVFVIELAGVKLKPGEFIFKNKAKQIIPFIWVAIGLFVWYTYAARYNERHASGIFLIGIMPIWNYSSADIASRITHFRGAMTLHQFYNLETLFLVIAMFLVTIIGFKKSNSFLTFITLLLFFAVIAFLILWFGAVTEGHDYYMTNLLVFVAFAFIAFIALIQKSFPNIFAADWFKMTFGIILVFNIYQTSAKTAIRYFNTQDRNFPACYSKSEIETIQWLKYNFHACIEPLREISPYLRKLGVKPDDRVLSLPDQSFDITLYFMNQKGWTPSLNPSITEEWFNQRINQGAKYLIVNDPNYLNNPIVSQFAVNKMGSYKNIQVFDLRTKLNPVSVDFSFDFEKEVAFLDAPTLSSGNAASGKNSCVFSSTREFGLTIDLKPSETKNIRFLKELTVSANYLLREDAYKGAILIFQIKNAKDSVLVWKGIEIDAQKNANWQNIKATLNFNGIKIDPADKINVYAWNTQKKNFAIDDIKVVYTGYK